MINITAPAITNSKQLSVDLVILQLTKEEMEWILKMESHVINQDLPTPPSESTNFKCISFFGGLTSFRWSKLKNGHLSISESPKVISDGEYEEKLALTDELDTDIVDVLVNFRYHTFQLTIVNRHGEFWSDHIPYEILK